MPDPLLVCSSSQAEFYYDGSLDLNAVPTNGNLTRQRHWEGTKWIATPHAYDPVTGNLTSTTDPLNNVTQFFYDATKALPISVVIDPLNGTGQQTSSTVYDFSTGLPLSVTDPNGRTTSTSYTNQLLGVVDPFNRPGVVTDPQGRTAVSRYRDSLRQVEVWSDLNTPNDAKLRSRTSADQLGRPIKSESSEDGVSYTVFADTVYPQIGKITVTTNPMRAQSASTDGWTRVTKDDLGRVLTVESFSGRYPSETPTGTVTTSYNATATTVTDQANRVRRSIVDGLGRLIRVDEPNSAGSLGSVTAPTQPTNYTYDSRGNLTQVSQGGQIRSFVYNGLSRLTQATNPESGTILYDYYDTGNLWHKTDARNVVTTFTYDGLNRVTTRIYSGAAPGPATPSVTYGYDAAGVTNSKGRLTSVSSSVSSYNYGSYDVMGRVATGTQTTDGQGYTMSYQYNLAGAMTSETYPSGRVVTTNFDAVGRLSSVTGQKSGEANKTYASQFSYAAHGAITSTTLGNNLVEATTFNGRLQPTFIKLGTIPNPTSVLQLGYEYTSACQPGNNGNVMRQTIAAPGLSLSQDYCYDSLNRLSSASENSGANWSQTYGYDRFGNRWVSASTGYTLSSLTSTSGAAFNTANNRLIASGYDVAGNQTSDVQGRMFDYDGENRQTKFNTTAGHYFYDGDGRRVKKLDSSGTTVFVYNAGGQLIAEYHSDPVPSPAGGGGTSYLTSDHLGSTRVVTNSGGGVKARYDYLPFGEELGATIGGRTVGMGYSAADSTKQKFTQKERDNESGLDYFLARYYSSAQGRFTSADPIMASGRTAEPSSWNRYVYVWNNPLIAIDPDGNEGIVVSGQPGPHENREHFLVNGLDRAKKLAAQYAKEKKGEKVTWFIYNEGGSGGFTDKEIKGYKEAAAKAGINVKVVSDSDDIVDYVNDKTGGGSRTKDLVTNFTYIGHATPGDLDIGYVSGGIRAWTSSELEVEDFDRNAFSSNSVANLVGGCNTAVAPGFPILERSVAEQMADKVGGRVFASNVTVIYPGGVVSDKELVRPKGGKIVEIQGRGGRKP